MPSGFQETNRFGMGAPTFTTSGSQGPQFAGGSIFNNSSYGSRGQAGGFNIPGGINFGAGSPGGNLGSAGAKLALHSGRFRTALQNMGYQNVADFQKATGFTIGGTGLGSGQGVGGAGRPPTSAFQFGGVAGDDDFYSNIGAKTYGVGRKVEDKANNIFNALGELGKYLHGGAPTATGPEQPAPEAPPRSKLSGLMKWMTDPSDAPQMRASGTRLAGAWGLDVPPDFPPWVHEPSGPWPLKQEPQGSGAFRPELYDQRSSGSMLARNTDTVPAMLTPGEVVLDDQQQNAVMPVPGREHMLLPNQRARLAKRMWS
jgi:hypothetical protein